MIDEKDLAVIGNRLALSVFGYLAGLALWGLTEGWAHAAMPPALYLALFTFLLVYALSVLALTGPVGFARALWGGAVLAALSTVLLSWAGQRFDLPTDVLDDPVHLPVIAIFVMIALPFVSGELQQRGAWRNYEVLFDTAWTITVRYSVAFGFVGVFWLVAFLSDALLALVDITFIALILRTQWAVFALTGGMLGLGLTVVYELRETVSPYLLLRLLRLLVPVVLGVVALFLAAVPVRGLGNLFGEFSAAATLMGTVIVAITLISAALDRCNQNAVATRGLRSATRALALLLPLLGGLSVWAVWLRVAQYGWTPDRCLAACVASILLIYSLGYGVMSVRHNWQAGVRQINLGLALLVILVGALWMTPVLNPYSISANSQASRFLATTSRVDQLPIWSLVHDWGRAGQVALAQLERAQDHPDHAKLAARIALARTEPNRFNFDNGLSTLAAPDRASQLAALMAVRPASGALTAQSFASLAPHVLEDWLEACKRVLPTGLAGCVLVKGAFSPGFAADAQGMVIYLSSDSRAQARHVVFRNGQIIDTQQVFDPVANRWPDLPAQVVEQALQGDFDVRPSNVNALKIGDWTLIPGH
ncbi:MAG: hypothetical protein AB8B51_16465 [Sedimentitalea sp.]